MLFSIICLHFCFFNIRYSWSFFNISTAGPCSKRKNRDVRMPCSWSWSSTVNTLWMAKGRHHTERNRLTAALEACYSINARQLFLCSCEWNWTRSTILLSVISRRFVLNLLSHLCYIKSLYRFVFFYSSLSHQTSLNKSMMWPLQNFLK